MNLFDNNARDTNSRGRDGGYSQSQNDYPSGSRGRESDFNQYSPAPNAATGALHLDVYTAPPASRNGAMGTAYEEYQRRGGDIKNAPLFDERDYFVSGLFQSRDFLSYAVDSLFHQADADNDGFLSKDESVAARTSQIGPSEQYLTGATAQISDIAAKDVNNQFGFNEKGATKLDIMRAFHGVKNYNFLAPNADSVDGVGSGFFNTLDVDQDGFLTIHEIDNENLTPAPYSSMSGKVDTITELAIVNPYIVHAHDDGDRGAKGLSLKDIQEGKEFIDKKYGAWLEVFGRGV